MPTLPTATKLLLAAAVTAALLGACRNRTDDQNAAPAATPDNTTPAPVTPTPATPTPATPENTPPATTPPVTSPPADNSKPPADNTKPPGSQQ